LRLACDRGWSFIRDAGTVILGISIVIWFLSSYPKLDQATFEKQQSQLAAQNDFQAPQNDKQRNLLEARLAQEHSILGRAGKQIQPVFEPLGFDWKTSVGVLASFAAREVVVSTLSVLYGAGENADSFMDRVSTAKRADGSPAFGTSTCVSLLVFFVLAMQCLPTQVVTRKETGSWKWAIFQLVYMTALAYGAAFVAKNLCDLIV
jgi:ferrous iron transport protein B